MSTTTRRIEIYIAEKDKEMLSNYKDTVNSWARLTRMASNIVMAVRFEMLGICQTLEFVEPKTLVKIESILKQERGMSKQNTTYRVLNSLIKGKIPTNIIASLNQTLFKKFEDMEFKIRKGECSLPSFKKGMPIPFPAKDVANIHKADDGYYYFTLYGIPFACRLGRDRSNNASIIEGVLSGKYKLSTSSIKVDGKDMYLYLCVKIPDNKGNLDPKTVVGLDLGINVPVTCAVNNSMEREYIGSREEFLKQKTAFNSRRKALQHTLRDAQGGKGRSHKLKALDKLRDAERNWTKTMNHTYSHRAVEFAVKQHAGVIQLEDLSGFGKRRDGKADERKEFLLRNWSYFELQTMIEYKAKMNGIKVKYIKPAYTSQRCSECGEIGIREDRDKTKFHCQNPQCSCYKMPYIHADWNGARNISKSKDYSDKNKDCTED